MVINYLVNRVHKRMQSSKIKISYAVAHKVIASALEVLDLQTGLPARSYAPQCADCVMLTPAPIMLHGAHTHQRFDSFPLLGVWIEIWNCVRFMTVMRMKMIQMRQ